MLCFAEVALCLLRDRFALPCSVLARDLQGGGGPEPTPETSLAESKAGGAVTASSKRPPFDPNGREGDRKVRAHLPGQGRCLWIGAGRAAARLLIGCAGSGVVGRVDASDPGAVWGGWQLGAAPWVGLGADWQRAR